MPSLYSCGKLASTSDRSILISLEKKHLHVSSVVSLKVYYRDVKRKYPVAFRRPWLNSDEKTVDDVSTDQYLVLGIQIDITSEVTINHHIDILVVYDSPTRDNRMIRIPVWDILHAIPQEGKEDNLSTVETEKFKLKETIEKAVLIKPTIPTQTNSKNELKRFVSMQIRGIEGVYRLTFPDVQHYCRNHYKLTDIGRPTLTTSSFLCYLKSVESMHLYLLQTILTGSAAMCEFVTRNENPECEYSDVLAKRHWQDWLISRQGCYVIGPIFVGVIAKLILNGIVTRKTTDLIECSVNELIETVVESKVVSVTLERRELLPSKFTLLLPEACSGDTSITVVINPLHVVLGEYRCNIENVHGMIKDCMIPLQNLAEFLGWSFPSSC